MLLRVQFLQLLRYPGGLPGPVLWEGPQQTCRPSAAGELALSYLLILQPSKYSLDLLMTLCTIASHSSNYSDINL